MDELLISEQAHGVIARAVSDGQAKGVELGGSLLALETDEATLIAYALPTGPGADQGWGHLRTDAAFQNRTIAAVQARWPALVYVGDWHVHPMWLPELSATDRRTARTILREEAGARDHLVLLLGTSAPGKSPVVLGFTAAEDGRGLSVQSVPLRRVADDARELTSRLGGALAPIGALLRHEGPEITVSEHADVGQVEAELEQIRSELDAEATLWMAGDTLGARVRRGRQEAVVLFPPEYPLGAPQVFSGSLESGPLRPIALRYGWSSLHRVSEVVAEALEHDGGAPSGRGPVRPPGFLRAALAWAGVRPSPQRPAPPARRAPRRPS
jgi:hypothetical protein